MKPFSIVFGFMMFIVLSCKKDSPANIALSLGEAVCQKNGTRLKSKGRLTPTAPTNSGLDLSIDFFIGENTLIENLYIFKIPTKKGKFSIKVTTPQEDDGLIGANYYTLTDEGDVLEETYIVDESSSDNFIEVVSYNEVASEVSGRFKINMKIDPAIGKRNPESLDVISIEEGEFYLKIE